MPSYALVPWCRLMPLCLRGFDPVFQLSVFVSLELYVDCDWLGTVLSFELLSAFVILSRCHID